MNGLISVIIPVYNAAKYLDACMESVLTQTYRDVEILLIDDGSDDGSGAMCDDYARRDPRVRAFHKENGGASSARNVGLRHAQGEFVFFLDSDDRAMPTLLEKLRQSAAENDAGIVFFDAYTVDERTGERSEKNYSHKERYAPDSGRNVLAAATANGDFHMGVCLHFYRRSLLEDNALFFREGIVYEDYLFTCVAYCLAKRVSHVPEFLYERLYRANSVMTSKKTVKNYVSAETVYYGVRDFSEQNGNVVPDAYLARGAYNVLTCAEALSARERETVSQLLKEVKRDVLAHNGYGDPALKMRCYGKTLWAARRALQKIIG